MYDKTKISNEKALIASLEPFLKENEKNITILSNTNVSDRFVVKYSFESVNNLLIERTVDMDSKEFKKYKKALATNDVKKIDKSLFLIDILEENSFNITTAA